MTTSTTTPLTFLSICSRAYFAALCLGKALVKEGKKLSEEGKDTGKELIEGFNDLSKPKK